MPSDDYDKQPVDALTGGATPIARILPTMSADDGSDKLERGRTPIPKVPPKPPPSSPPKEK